MTRRCRKYFIDVPSAQKFLLDAYGLRSKVVNEYHLKVYHDEFNGVFEWYHTQGTVVATTEHSAKNIGEAGTDEDLAIIINKKIKEYEQASKIRPT